MHKSTQINILSALTFLLFSQRPYNVAIIYRTNWETLNQATLMKVCIRAFGTEVAKTQLGY